MPLVPIDDAEDPRLDDYRNVADRELLERRGIFVAEGRLVVRRLLAGSRFDTRSVLVTAPALASIADSLPAAATVYLVAQAVMNAITGFHIHRGCLAIGERRTAPDLDALLTDSRRLVLLERIGNADNVGAIFRSAAAFSVDAVVLDDASTDPLYRKAIRTSMGAALALPWARADDWLDLLRRLDQQGVMMIGLTPSRDACVLREAAARIGARPVALLVGHEGDGLTPHALQRCHALARIPMREDVDSLNVATAAAIALYELATASEVRS